MSRNASADAEEPVSLPAEGVVWPAFLKTLRHFFPDLQSWLKILKDPRDPRFTVYPVDYVVASGIFLFLTKIGSRRQMRYHFKTPAFIHNLNVFCGTSCETMLDPDTLAYLMERLSLQELEGIRQALLYTLIRNRVFDEDRLLGKYFRVAVDGTGHLAFAERHCKHCLTQKQGDVTRYYHPVLEAKLVTRSGFCLSIATEFIENPEPGFDKQDCERKAFVRLAERLKKDFPQLRICILLDGLYACGPVFDLCRGFGWSYIITFKEGSAPAVFEDYEQLKAAGSKAHPQALEETQQTFWWVNGVPFSGRSVNVLECQERNRAKESRRFVWVTDLRVEEATFSELADDGGRLRWKIENEGFNVQKNNGYEMEHAYSEHEQASKNFYLLLQIAHILSQLVEKGLLAKRMTKSIGAIRNVARFLLEELRRLPIDIADLTRLLERRIQIRFADSS